MSVSAENPVTNEFASFWELKSYMRTVKRVENANKLCSDLSQMIAERASIENAYADNLKKWSTKWRSLIDTGIEYGTGANPWLGLCTEASDISEIHKGISDVLLNNIHPSVKSWTKEQFHKSHVPGYPLKESKRIETDFELAQKPWAKKLKKLTQRQKEYYLACKTLRSLKVQAENARNDPVGNTEQNEIKLKKIQEKTKKAEQDEAQSLDSYKAALVDLDSDKPRYIEDMRRVFQKSQELESSRLQFFKSTFINFYETLDLTKKSQIPSIYSKLIGSINMSVPSEDLNIWSGSHGIDMRFVIPEFEDYSPELLAITKKKVNSVSDSHPPGVTLTGMAQVASPPRLNANQYTGYNNNNDNEVSTDLGFATNGMSKTITTSDPPPETTENDNVTPTSGYGFITPDDHFEDSVNDVLYDDGRPGVPVRALYDYQGVEDDELTFAPGDVFEKLEDENDQGWAKGRKEGRVGLYPANYVELV